ncbi:hypothetical protein GCM10010413_32100 [Promicromonospora sukumoe]|uniref:Uncharacterized protein n=1 Tax=Promicromonospora sukumoe TaxID=88382 RepID=A0A7W3J865_9MICO|nr:hypothetical protein [Promicromonospora sukumoe]MBA8807964.1 hypothetical protein [Promicromonospora sukumoe]
MTWETLNYLDGWQWVAAAATWLVTLALSVIVGSWVVPWVLRRAGRGDLPWARYKPPVYPQAVEPGEAASGEGASGKAAEGTEAEPAKGEKNEKGSGGLVPDGEESPTGTMHPDAVAILRGGAWLGVLERLAITGSLLAGYPYGIAIVIAIKGLGRYAELRDQPVASERFVVGTLASLIWSVATGLLGLIVLNALVL